MNLPNQPRIRETTQRFSLPTTPRCERGGQIRKIDEILSELLDQYQVRFPGLQPVLIETPAATW
jgi:hypothetical protein